MAALRLLGKQGSSAMRLSCVVFAALLVLSAAGCTTDGRSHSTAWYTTLPGFRGPTGPDVVQVEWALIERPVGDRYLNEDLWSLANEQVVPLERKDTLENNGLRIAQIGGLLPAEFQELLRSERSNPNARRRLVRAGQPASLVLGPARASFSVLAPNTPRDKATGSDEGADSFENAQFNLVVTPALAAEGKVRLAFKPEIQFGQPKVAIRPSEGGAGWAFEQRPSTRSYGELSWDVTVSSNEFILVGGCFKRENTFGKECFIRVDEPKPVQRLLVIRASRQVMEAVGFETAEENVPPRTVATVAQGSGTPLH
jgi:hypothetical protein